jgi:hypothetical protein
MEVLTKKDPGNDWWQRDRAAFELSTGDVLLAMAKADEAILAYREGLAIRRALAAKQPGNARWQSDLGRILGTIGIAFLKLEKLSEALANERESCFVFVQLVRTYPGQYRVGKRAPACGRPTWLSRLRLSETKGICNGARRRQ